jgi:hypothetical protein
MFSLYVCMYGELGSTTSIIKNVHMLLVLLHLCDDISFTNDKHPLSGELL